MKTKLFTSLACLLVLVGFTPNALAVDFTSSELIEDVPPFELFDRDLTRTRVDGAGNVIVEMNDATITADNNVDNNFGVLNKSTVNYRHDLTWLTPPADVFVYASLTIKSFGALGSNDIVTTETIDLGSLVNGTFGTGFFSTTVFASANPVLLNALLADGYLDISIDKNAFGGFLSGLNAISVYSSKLDVRYEEVPEPATMVLLGSGVLMGFSRRRKAAK